MTSVISGIINTANKGRKIYKAYNTTKEILAVGDLLFSPKNTVTSDLFEKIIPTKRYWRKNNTSDIRGFSQRRLEEAREKFGIEIGPAFDNRRVKDLFLADTSQSFCVYQLIKHFFSDTHLIDALYVGSNSNKKDDVKNKINALNIKIKQAQELRCKLHILISRGSEIQQSLTHLNNSPSQQRERSSEAIEKEIIEIQDRYVEMTMSISETDNKLQELYSSMNDEFTYILENISKLSSENEVNNTENSSGINEKLKDLFAIIKNKTFNLSINEDIFSFICIRENIETDPEFEFKVATLIYRILYDPVSCYDLALSLGKTGQALIACLSTRSSYFQSRKVLPDSAFIFFKMLGLKKESFQIIDKKWLEKDKNNVESPAVNLTSAGSLLFLDILNIEQKSQSEIDTFLLNMFGESRREKGDKNGYINSIFDEINARYNKYSISDYLKDKDVLKKRKDFSKSSRNTFIDSLKILEKKSYNRDNNAFEQKFENRYKNIILCLESMKNCHNLGQDNFIKVNALLNAVKEKIERSYNDKTIDLLELNNLEKDTSDFIQSLYNKNDMQIDLFLINNEHISKFCYTYNLKFYYKSYDLKINHLAKMSSSFIVPNGAIRSIVENVRNKVDFTTKKVKAEILSLNENKDFLLIKKVCSDQQAFLAMICCHKRFSQLDLQYKGKNANPEIMNDIINEVSSTFIKNISKIFMSGSVAAVNFIKKLNKDFIDLISNMIFKGQYSDFANIVKVKVKYDNGNERFFSFGELSNRLSDKYPTINSENDSNVNVLPLNFINEILEDPVAEFEIVLDENSQHNKFLNNLKNIVEQFESMFSQENILGKISSELLLYQKKSFLKVIKQIIFEFNLSGSVADEICKLSNDITVAYEHNNQEKIREISIKIEENQAINSIFKKLLNLSTIPLQDKFSLTNNKEFDFLNRKIAGKVKLNYLYTGKSNIKKNIQETRSSGLFYNIFKFIMEEINDAKVRESVDEQLKDENNLRIKIQNISNSFYETIVDFSEFIEKSLIIYSKIIQKISDVLRVCDMAIIETNPRPLAEDITRQAHLFFSKLQDINKFSVQLNDVTTRIEKAKQEIEGKLHEISISIKRDQIFKDKSSALDVILCSNERAEDFESAFLFPSQIKTQNQINKLKNKGDRQVITIHDTHPFKDLLANDFKEFISTFFSSRLNSADGQSFIRILDLCSIFQEKIHLKPYYYEGYYFRGSGYEREMIKLLKIHRNMSVPQITIQDKELIILKINNLKKVLQDEIYKYNTSMLNENNEKHSFLFLENIKKLFNKLHDEIYHIFENKSIDEKTYNELKDLLEYIGDIKKFNIEFFKIGIDFINKLTTFSRSKKFETEYHEYMSNLEIYLIQLRKEIYLLETSDASKEHNTEFFLNKRKIDTQFIDKCKTIFSNYTTEWERVLELSLNINLKKSTRFLTNKITSVSKKIVEIEREIINSSTLFSILERDRDIGSRLYGELILFRLLKQSGSLSLFKRLKELLSGRAYNGNTNLPLSYNEEKELRETASALQKQMNSLVNQYEKYYFNKSSKFSYDLEFGFFKKIVTKLQQIIFSSSSSSALQVQTHISATEKLKNSVRELIKEIEDYAYSPEALRSSLFTREILSFDHEMQYVESLINYLVKFENDYEFLKIISSLNFQFLNIEEAIKSHEKILSLLQSELKDNFLPDMDQNQSELFKKIDELHSIVQKIFEQISKNKFFGNENNYIDTNLAEVRNNCFNEKYFAVNTDKLNILNTKLIHLNENSKLFAKIISIFPYSEILNILKDNSLTILDLFSLVSEVGNINIIYSNFNGKEVYTLRSLLNMGEISQNNFIFNVSIIGERCYLYFNGEPVSEGVSQILDAKRIVMQESAILFYNSYIKGLFNDLKTSDFSLIDSLDYNITKDLLENYCIYIDPFGGKITCNLVEKSFHFYPIQNNTEKNIIIIEEQDDQKMSIMLNTDKSSYYVDSVSCNDMKISYVFNACKQAYFKNIDRTIDNNLLSNSIDAYIHSYSIFHKIKTFINKLSLTLNILNIDDDTDISTHDSLTNSLSTFYKYIQKIKNKRSNNFSKLNLYLLDSISLLIKRGEEITCSKEYKSKFIGTNIMEIHFSNNIYKFSESGFYDFIKHYCNNVGDDYAFFIYGTSETIVKAIITQEG